MEASFFSLGIDSFFTLFEYEKYKSIKIENLILVSGFDIDYKNKSLLSRVIKNATEVSKNLNKNLIVIETNLRTLLDHYISWDMAHGAALASIGYFLSKRISLIYFNNEDAMISEVPYGTHRILNKLWSSRILKFENAKLVKRSEATKSVADYPLVQKYLRVCWENIDNKYNCCKCQKCLRTQLQLVDTNNFERFTTFSKKLPLHLLDTMVEPRHRWFLWLDLLHSSKITTHIKFSIIGMLLRSYFVFYRRRLRLLIKGA